MTRISGGSRISHRRAPNPRKGAPTYYLGIFSRKPRQYIEIKHVMKFLRKQDYSGQKGLHHQLEGVENIFTLNRMTFLHKLTLDCTVHDLISLTGRKLCAVLVNTEFDD